MGALLYCHKEKTAFLSPLSPHWSFPSFIRTSLWKIPSSKVNRGYPSRFPFHKLYQHGFCYMALSFGYYMLIRNDFLCIKFLIVYENYWNRMTLLTWETLSSQSPIDTEGRMMVSRACLSMDGGRQWEGGSTSSKKGTFGFVRSERYRDWLCEMWTHLILLTCILSNNCAFQDYDVSI